MKINLLAEIKSMPVKDVADFGLAVSFMDLFQRLQALYGLDNKDLLEAWLVDLERSGSIRIHRVGGILSYIAPINHVME